jgi:hypothetical protein
MGVFGGLGMLAGWWVDLGFAAPQRDATFHAAMRRRIRLSRWRACRAIAATRPLPRPRRRRGRIQVQTLTTEMVARITVDPSGRWFFPG